MSGMASQITRLTTVCSNVYTGAGQRKHQSSALQACVWGIHRWPGNSPHKGPVTRKMFPFDDVIMYTPGTMQIRYTDILRVCSYHYKKYNCGDKTAVTSSYLHNGNSYTGKIVSQHWITPLYTGSPLFSILDYGKLNTESLPNRVQLYLFC